MVVNQIWRFDTGVKITYYTGNLTICLMLFYSKGTDNYIVTHAAEAESVAGM